MTSNLKNVPAAVIITILSALLFGCGEGRETSTPSVQLSASKVASSTVSAHSHSVTIPFSDVSLTPANTVTQYRSDTVNGHSHVIAFSAQQMIDLSNGLQLSLTSSAPDTGAAHIHVWNIQGGSVLYEKNCYNCHSNDKRNNNPMNVSFNAGQTAAVKNPGGASLSNSTAAIPDPSYQPSVPATPPAASPDGALLYASKCASCHSLGTVDPTGSSPNLSGKGTLVSGKFPVPGVVSHNGRSLTAAEIAAIVSYVNAN